MNVTESRQVAALLQAVFVDGDPDAALVIARDLAERTRKVLLQTGIPYVSPRQLTVPAAAEESPRCFWCGCTDEQACAGGCAWVPGPIDEGDLCSRCAAELALLAAALDDAAAYRELRGSARCEACASAGDGRCAGHQSDERRSAAYRELLAGRYSAYLPGGPAH
jgi:hypothetical protein